MKLVVVGGQARDVGKTLVVSGIIRGLRSLDWTAVKITPHGHGLNSSASGLTDGKPRSLAFVLSEETRDFARGDTGRFLAAGAKRAIWLRVQPGRLGEALPALMEALAEERFVIVESNSILNVLKPAVFVFVLGNTRRDFKSSALKLLRRADALVAVESGFVGPIGRGIHPGLTKNKPAFLVSRRIRTNLRLCRFVRRRLGLEKDSLPDAIQSPSRDFKEQTWLH